jgi:hypothetical protein
MLVCKISPNNVRWIPKLSGFRDFEKTELVIKSFPFDLRSIAADRVSILATMIIPIDRTVRFGNSVFPKYRFWNARINGTE